MFLYIYIIAIWRNRKENLRIGILKSIIVKKIVEHLDFIKVLQKSKLDEIFQKISRLDIENLKNL